MNLTLLPHRTLGSTHPGGRILKCFPHPIAGSAARTVAGPTLKNERAEVRGAPARVARREFGPLFPAVRTQGIGGLYRIHCDPRCSSPTCSAHSMGNASSLFGGRILQCFPRRIASSPHGEFCWRKGRGIGQCQYYSLELTIANGAGSYLKRSCRFPAGPNSDSCAHHGDAFDCRIGARSLPSLRCPTAISRRCLNPISGAQLAHRQ